jgi:hypothetical protein
MSDKQAQSTSFFQNKKRKTNDDFDRNSASIDISSDDLSEAQGQCGTASSTL